MILSTPTIDICFNGHEIRNDDEVETTLQPLLMPKIACHSNGGQQVVSRKAESLLRTKDGPSPARGLREVLAACARDQGIEPRIRGTRLSKLTECQTNGAILNPAVVQLMRDNETGLIRYSPGVLPEQIALDIVRAFPNDTIYFPSCKYARASSLAKHFRQHGQPCHVLGKQHQYLQLPEDDSDVPRMVVSSTFGGVDPYHFPKSAVAVLIDATEITRQAARAAIADPDEARFRLFGFVRNDQRLSPRERIQLMSAFGIHEVEVRPGGRQKRHIELAMVDYRRRDGKFSQRPAPTINQLFAANRERNTVVRTVANGIYNRSLGCSRHYRQLHDWLGSAAGSEELNVAVVVEKLPHALRLAPLLKGWPLACASQLTPGVLQRMPKADRDLFDERCDRTRTPLHRRLICTALGASSVPGFVPDVVIWAGGIGGVPRLPNSWTECLQRNPTKLLIVDFNDEFHHEAAAMSRQRQQRLNTDGIYRVGCSPAYGRVLDFVQEQMKTQLVQAS